MAARVRGRRTAERMRNIISLYFNPEEIVDSLERRFAPQKQINTLTVVEINEIGQCVPLHYL